MAGRLPAGLHKTALNGLTVMWASALREEGIKVNSADPAYVATDLNYHSGNSTVEQGAEIIVTLAILAGDGPTGSFQAAGGTRRKRGGPGQFSIQAIRRPRPFSWTGLHMQDLLLAIIKTGRYTGLHGDHPHHRSEGPDRRACRAGRPRARPLHHHPQRPR